jgi:hypothetical protein
MVFSFTAKIAVGGQPIQPRIADVTEGGAMADEMQCDYCSRHHGKARVVLGHLID